MNNNELYHHGIMGMKWGVRRYQNSDGSLTAKGKARFAKVASSERKQKRDTKTAIKALKKQKKSYDDMENRYAKAVDKDIKKYNKLVDKSQQAKTESAKSKYESKAWKKMAKMQLDAQNGRVLQSMSSSLDVKIKNIESGKVKAGRDFIVQRDYNVWAVPVLTPYSLWVVGDARRDISIIEKPRK